MRKNELTSGGLIMNLRERMGIISKIVIASQKRERPPVIGKTAIMKYLYILQKVYKLPLGYEYGIYTYGPYASMVMSDINHAEALNIINIGEEDYGDGVRGYSITPAESADEYEKEINSQYEDAVLQVLKQFADKNAKELELLTTIIYVYSNFKENAWPLEEVPLDVHQIKPRFSIENITDEYRHLDEIGVLSQAVSY